MTLNGRFVADRSWAEAVVPAVLGGAAFGAVMGPIAARDNRRVIEAAGYLPPGKLGRAVRLARRGAVPEDPELRRAARRIAQHQRDRMRSQRWWPLFVFGVLAALSLWIALDGGAAAWLGWLGSAFFLVLLVAPTLMAGHLARRAELLAEPPS